MSILKKLFGKSESAEAADSKNTEQSSSKSENRLAARPPRVKLTELHRVRFTLAQPGGEGFPLGNISTGGMGVIYTPGELWKPDSLISGSIAIDAEEYQIQARIRHLSEVLAGCEFQGDTGSLHALRKTIENYLRVEILALSLRKVSEAYMKPDPRGTPLWLTDGGQNELYVTTDGHGVSSFHMNFLGHYFEYDRMRGLKGGEITQSEDKRAIGHKGSTMLQLHATLREDSVGAARIFIENLDKLPEDLRQVLHSLLAMPGAPQPMPAAKN